MFCFLSYNELKLMGKAYDNAKLFHNNQIVISTLTKEEIEIWNEQLTKYGKEIIKRAVENVKKAGIDEVIAVVGYQREQIQEVLADSVKYAIQEEQLGTGHAVKQAAKLLEGRKGKVLVLNGDHPIMRPQTLKNLVEVSKQRGESGTILTMVHENILPYDYIIVKIFIKPD